MRTYLDTQQCPYTIDCIITFGIPCTNINIDVCMYVCMYVCTVCMHWCPIVSDIVGVTVIGNQCLQHCNTITDNCALSFALGHLIGTVSALNTYTWQE